MKISFSTQLQVAFNAGNGLTCREISNRCCISKSSANRILQEMKNQNIQNEKIDVFTQMRCHFVAMHLFNDPSITNHRISVLSQEFEFKMSESTVGRISHSMGFRSRFQQPKEKLTQKQKEFRVKFGKEIRTTQFYKIPWCFSDESIICVEPMRKKIRVIPSVECDMQFVEKQGYPGKIMVWACIGKDFKSDLIRIDGNLNADTYQKMLTEHKIIEKLNDKFGENGFVFQQDGARPHTAKSTKLYLRGKVTTLPDDLHWPASSPDLNVIEILWAILKSQIDITKINNADDLYRAAVEIWEKIPQDTINLLIDSFDARLVTCVSIGGESLNGKKMLIKRYKVSIEDGDNYLKNLINEKNSIRIFIQQSKRFFSVLKTVDFTRSQCNRNNHNDSSKICSILPERLRKKMKLPRPLLVHSR